MLLTEYDEKKLRGLFLAEGENRAWQKYGMPREDFRKMAEE